MLPPYQHTALTLEHKPATLNCPYMWTEHTELMTAQSQNTQNVIVRGQKSRWVKGKWWFLGWAGTRRRPVLSKAQTQENLGSNGPRATLMVNVIFQHEKDYKVCPSPFSQCWEWKPQLMPQQSFWQDQRWRRHCDLIKEANLDIKCDLAFFKIFKYFKD